MVPWKFTKIIIKLIASKLRWSCTRQIVTIPHLKHTALLLYKLECFIGISTTEKNQPAWKIIVIFHVFWDSQSAVDTSLTPSSAMNEWQRVLFLKRELSRLPLVAKMFI